MKIIVNWNNILDVSDGKVITISVQQIHSGQHCIISSEKDSSMSDKVVYGRSELDSHADNTVA